MKEKVQEVTVYSPTPVQLDKIKSYYFEVWSELPNVEFQDGISHSRGGYPSLISEIDGNYIWIPNFSLNQVRKDIHFSVMRCKSKNIDAIWVEPEDDLEKTIQSARHFNEGVIVGIIFDEFFKELRDKMAFAISKNSLIDEIRFRCGPLDINPIQDAIDRCLESAPRRIKIY